MRFLFLTSVLTACGIATPAQAQDFCSSLSQAINASTKEFSTLKGTWDAKAGRFTTPWAIDGASGKACFMNYDKDDDHPYSPSCEWAADSFLQANAKAESLSNKVVACFKPGVYAIDAWKDANRSYPNFDHKTRVRFISTPISESDKINYQIGSSCFIDKKTAAAKCRTYLALNVAGRNWEIPK
jgi:hypothetical protein